MSFTVLDHLHLAEGEVKIDRMAEEIVHGLLAVAHRQGRDQDQDALVGDLEDILLHLGRGKNTIN